MFQGVRQERILGKCDDKCFALSKATNVCEFLLAGNADKILTKIMVSISEEKAEMNRGCILTSNDWLGCMSDCWLGEFDQDVVE